MRSSDGEKPSVDESSYTLLNDDIQKPRCEASQAWLRRFLILNAVGLMLILVLLSFLSFMALTRSTFPLLSNLPRAHRELVLPSHGTALNMQESIEWC